LLGQQNSSHGDFNARRYRDRTTDKPICNPDFHSSLFCSVKFFLVGLSLTSPNLAQGRGNFLDRRAVTLHPLTVWADQQQATSEGGDRVLFNAQSRSSTAALYSTSLYESHGGNLLGENQKFVWIIRNGARIGIGCHPVVSHLLLPKDPDISNLSMPENE
jgi:hypothetical protein